MPCPAARRSGNHATLLPSASFNADGPDAPARALIDAGVAVALGTNFNPASYTDAEHAVGGCAGLRAAGE